MSTLQARITDLATRMATECKSLRTLINKNASDLSALTTTQKGSLVAAINELKTAIDGGARNGANGGNGGLGGASLVIITQFG